MNQSKTSRIRDSGGIGLYIHFPWCVKKCPYCDFNSHRAGATLDQPQYVQTLLLDLDYELTLCRTSRPIASIFMGGGTPSLFSPDAMEQLLHGVNERLSFDENVEITMEANPGTTEHADFSAYRQAGINRLSLGVQSFDDAQLKTLGRVHSAREAHDAFSNARRGGFDNINVDLMFALPNQRVEQALLDIDTAISLKPEHISAYQLTLEPDTVFYRYPPPLPSEDTAFEIELALQQRLESAAYSRYEISAYSQNGKRCQHNLNYWNFGDYLGIGAGAHGKISEGKTITRRSRKKHPGTYISLAGRPESIAESREVSENEILFEFLMNALRLIEGVDISVVAQRTELPRDVILDKLKSPINQQLVSIEDNTLRCTQSGQLFLDSILTDLLT